MESKIGKRADTSSPVRVRVRVSVRVSVRVRVRVRVGVRVRSRPIYPASSRATCVMASPI